MSILNIVKVTKLEVRKDTVWPESQKPGLQPPLNALYEMLPLLLPCDDVKLFANGHKRLSSLSDKIHAQTCTVCGL